MKNTFTKEDLKALLFLAFIILTMFVTGWRVHELYTETKCQHTCEQCEWEEYLEYEEQFYEDRDAGKFN